MRLRVWLHRGIGALLLLGAAGSTVRPVASWVVALVWIFGPQIVRRLVGRMTPAPIKERRAQRQWLRQVRRTWPEIAHAAGLVHAVPERLMRRWADQGAVIRIAPELREATAHDHGFRIVVAACIGQTTEELRRGAQRLRDTFGVDRVIAREVGPGVVCFDFRSSDPLMVPREARFSEAISHDAVLVGRGEDGIPWPLQVSGLHTLVVGCSGSGKGSVFWSIACGLAPSIRAGLVRLYGIDLKMGMEVGIGRPLFSAVATDEREAVAVLELLDRDMRARGRRMQGVSRRHEPTPAEPLVVLMIDELVALTSYVSDANLRKQAAELLSRLLTQGRAVGFVVVGCLQDPRKEVLPMRNLFTQTIALRLRSREEVAMVLGAGMAEEAPADRIGTHEQGMAYVVAEDGSVQRVRADFWPDELIRQVGARHPAVHTEWLALPEPAPEASPRPRKPRARRTNAA